MKSLTKSLIRSGLIVASLALTGSGAMAADAEVHHRPRVVHVTHPHTTARAAARYRQPPFASNNDLGQFIEGFFGGVVPQPYARLMASSAARASLSHRGSAGTSPRRPMTTRRRSTQVRPAPMRRRRPIKRSSKYSR